MSESYSERLKDPRWAALREKILARDGHACVVCGRSRGLQVHHGYYDRRDPWDYESESLWSLCVTCHGKADEARVELRRLCGLIDPLHHGTVIEELWGYVPRRPDPPAVKPASGPDPRLAAAFEALIGCVLLDNSLIPALRPRRAACPAGDLDRILDAIFELWDATMEDAEALIDEVLVLQAMGEDPARDSVIAMVENAATASSPQDLARDQLRFLEQREREGEVRRRLDRIEEVDLDDENTRAALRALHAELRAIKVPPRGDGARSLAQEIP